MRTASIIGVIIGCIAGYLMAKSMLSMHTECERIRQENQQLRELLTP